MRTIYSPIWFESFELPTSWRRRQRAWGSNVNKDVILNSFTMSAKHLFNSGERQSNNVKIKNIWPTLFLPCLVLSHFVELFFLYVAISYWSCHEIKNIYNMMFWQLMPFIMVWRSTAWLICCMLYSYVCLQLYLLLWTYVNIDLQFTLI